MPKIRVLIVDDSALMRKALTEALEKSLDILVVGTACDAIIAKEKIPQLAPDVLTLDIEMPRMNGLSFLKSLMADSPLPVLIVSSQIPASQNAAVEALQNGAIEVVPKPQSGSGWAEFGVALAAKVRAAAGTRPKRGINGSRTARLWPPSLESASSPDRSLIAVGSSTGGPEALTELLMGLPANCAPIVIAQHIPSGFSRALAERLDRECAMEVKEAQEGDLISPGRVLIAPGGLHLTVRRSGGVLRAALQDGPPVCYQRPSVDVLFRSVTEVGAREAVGVVLTGMGNDGADGLLRMRNAGARTVVQDQGSCVVFGMPRAAIEAGAAERIMPLQEIAPQLLKWMRPYSSARISQ